MPSWSRRRLVLGGAAVLAVVTLGVLFRTGGPIRPGAGDDDERRPTTSTTRRPVVRPTTIVRPTTPAVVRPASGPAHFFVSSDGSPTGAGTADDPFALDTAFHHPTTVLPGDVVWIAGGVYRGCHTVVVAGEPGRPIVIRAVPGERVVLDVAGCTARERTVWVDHASHDLWLWGLEVTNSSPGPRRVEGRQRDRSPRLKGLTLNGERVRLINTVLRENAGGGLAVFSRTRGAEVDGLLSFRNGYQDDARGHGHGVYTQSEDPRLLRDVVAFQNFGTGVKAYARSGPIEHVRFDGVVAFDNSSTTSTHQRRQPNLVVAAEGDRPASDVEVVDSHFYVSAGGIGANVSLGYTDVNKDLSVVRTSVLGSDRPLILKGWETLEMTETTVMTRADRSGQPFVVRASPAAGKTFAGWSVDRNTYLNPGFLRTPFVSADGDRAEFADWQAATGFDRASTYSTDGLQPAPRVTVRPSRYETGRALVVVENLAGAASVALDLDRAGLCAGQRFEVRDVQRWTGTAIARGAHQPGLVVSLELSGLVADPWLTEPPHDPGHTNAEFNVFVVLPLDTPAGCARPAGLADVGVPVLPDPRSTSVAP